MFAGAESQAKQGAFYQSADIQSLQADDFQNPGMLAVDEGRLLAQSKQASDKSCLDCHNDFSGIAAEFPKYNSRLGKLVGITGQIQACREEYQQTLSQYEDEAVLALSAYVTHQSRGKPFKPVSKNLEPALQRGKDYYYRRKGQLNLACSHCHESNPGKLLRGDLISQGVSTGYPAYRLEWQSLGSLHRRFRACDIGVRAEPDILGGQVYTELELYLRARAGKLPITAPAVRR